LIAIFDYGSGNLKSAYRAFQTSGEDVLVTADPAVAKKAKGLVVPGVGAFSACMSQLYAAGGVDLIKERILRGDSILGICVGMQVLFKNSNEKGIHEGISIFSGSVERLNSNVLPHIGWNTIETSSDSILFSGLSKESFYFVHSYAALKAEPDAINITSNYGGRFLAAIERGNVFATQFHPEKSGQAGLKLIKNWVANL
jgi:imidazole glycerol-phosphate synthase subunit HisH